jgi:hypothetical protein
MSVSRLASWVCCYNLAELDPVIYGLSQILFAANIPFGREHRRVPEQELDLFKFTSGRMAPSRAVVSGILCKRLAA